MKAPAMTQGAKTILMILVLLLSAGGSVAAQSRTKDGVKKRAHRIFAAQTGADQVTLAWDEVPGTTEYRIYLPDPQKPGPPEPGSRPDISFSGSGRRATITGVSRMAAGAYLEALGKGEGEVLYRGTFNAVARAPLANPKAPAAVQARETGETEVTLSWNPVPGATAYMISRAVGGSGWQMLCDVCPPLGELVDTTATPGLEHTYSVSAIFPLGISTRTSSNSLTVGAAQLAAAAASAPPAAAWDKPMSSGTPVAGTDGDNTNAGASAGIPTTGTTTVGPGTGTTTPSTGSTSNPCTPVVVPKIGTATIYTKPMSSGVPMAGTEGDNTNAGASAGIPTTGSGGCPTGPGTGTNTGTGTGTGTNTGTGTGTGTGTTAGWTPGGVPAGSGTTTQLPAGGSGPVHAATPVTGTPIAPAAASCKLDYRRADNMWADFGRPDGNLGTESISVANGQAKVFVTDWAYEKQRNDGVNYYGSHLRVATNPGIGVIQLRIKNPGLAMFGKIAAMSAGRIGDPGWLIMKPGDQAEFRDDLMEVHCGQ